MKVLIAEDDAVSGLILERTLTRWGYEVLRARNGEEAWEKYQAEPVSLVITDWMMPQTDGLELCRRIRSSHSSHYTYIILLSAKSQKNELVEGMGAGADDFITKPFDSSELQMRLRAGERILDLEASLKEQQEETQAVNRQLESSIERQRLINQLLGSLTSSLDFETVLRDAVIPLQALFKSSRAYIRLVNQEQNTLRVGAEKCAKNILPMGDISFPFEPSAADETVDQYSLAVIEDLTQTIQNSSSVVARMMAHGFEVRSLLSEPLTMQGMWFGDIGLQQCGEVREWGEEDIVLLKTITQQISVVAVNSALHRKVQEQSVRDAMTGLFNRRYFDEAMTIEFERASRYNQPLTLVMVDLDHLKVINDEQGHLAGDAAIKMIGEVLLKQSRRVDIATRYGGEEFILILPQTPLEGGQAASEHWRAAINQCFVGNHQLSASIGVASYPMHATSAERLIRAADIAMYRAKREGRNRVCIAGLAEIEARNAG